MPKLVMKIYNVSVALFIVGLLGFMYSEERSSEHTSLSKPEAEEIAVPAEFLEGEVNEYITKTEPIVQRHGYPEVYLELVNNEDDIWIAVRGRSVAETEEIADEYKMILNLILPLTYPPVRCVDEVEYSVSPQNGITENHDVSEFVEDNDPTKEEVSAYITKTMERYDLSERGIKMEMLDTTEGLRIHVCGEVENEESLKVLQLIFENPISNPDLPVPFVWNVEIKQM